MFEKKFMSFYCRCLHYFSSSEKLEAHTVDCEKMNECAIVLPDDESKWLSFDNYIRKERFVVYADLECILEKTDREAPRSTYQHHKVFNIAYYVQCAYDSSLSVYQCHRDANCVSWFVKELKNLAHFVKLILSNNIQMDDITSEQQEAFRNATHCHICEKPFGENDTRVRDHCHLTGRYRGPAYSNCNLNYTNSFCIPTVFYNLSGYDSHFIIEEITIAFEDAVSVLPITKEKYISFTKSVKDPNGPSRNCIQLRFIDSYKFLSTSLNKLASFLDKSKLRILRTEFQNLSTEDFEL
ncbi:uncharacterized protein LOC128892337 [Hylaeus anthracinus]|uniref:uncharacterized protein LOC128892337 n=1 Tax=Hylaeus anthracinus TaxID=313031 RepID=UPI0023B9DBAD|nr:uncharacterized protein LOC128892337 [Hylaeus anthracinus]